MERTQHPDLMFIWSFISGGSEENEEEEEEPEDDDDEGTNELK